jgi:hypothetical protein
LVDVTHVRFGGGHKRRRWAKLSHVVKDVVVPL